jgi:hypothetical protein
MSDRFSACLNFFAHLNDFKQAILNANSTGHSNAVTEYLGPLPPNLIEYGRFGVAVRNMSNNQNEAHALIAFMTSLETAPLLRKTAMEPPAR